MIRFFYILWVIHRFRLDEFLDKSRLPWYFRCLTLTFSLFPVPSAAKGERLRQALETLGPLFIKFGQLLATRKDLLSQETMDALALLQDRVAPFDGQRAKVLIETALNGSVDTFFKSFDAEPLASASIAQVHAAILPEGEAVVVKVVRPGIEQIIRRDLALLLFFARLLFYCHPDGKRLRPVEVVREYSYTLLDELDLKKEAANTSQLRRNFQDSSLLYVPKVYWPYCRDNVLVMERIDGLPVNDVAAIKAQGTDLKVLAERGVEIFFTQVFSHSFFHADMHPGNIFVAKSPITPPKYIAIDCAIVGSLDAEDQYYVARCLLAIFHRDYHLVAQLHVESGWVARDTRVSEFESAIRSVCEPIFEKPLSEISFAELLLYLFQTARRFDMQVQPSLVLLQKTLLHIEGLGRQIYPDLDLWDTAMPYLEKWMKDRYSPTSMLKQVEKHLPGWLEHLPDMPDLVYTRLSEQKQIKGDRALALLRRQVLQQGRINIFLSVSMLLLVALLLWK